MADISDTQSLIQELKNVTTFKRENYSFVWRIAQFSECVDRKYEFYSPMYNPISEKESTWKMMVFSTDLYPEDGNGKYCLMQNREKVFRHCLDFDECTIIDNKKLKEKNLLSNGFLTINCKMDVLILENPKHSSSTISSQSDIPSATNILKYTVPTTFERNITPEGDLKGNSRNDSSHYSISQSLELLSNDFKSFYLNKQDCDITIRVSDGELHAHKAVLIARSNYFRKACINQRGTSGNPEICISEIKSIIMEFILYYMYTGHMRQLTFEMAMEILPACQQFQLAHLEKCIQNFLKSEININSVIDVFKASINLKIDSLKHSALKFMSLNHEELSKTVKWQEMMKCEPRSAGEVLLTVASYKKNLNSNK